jgi:hypothetical protein
LPLAIGMLMSSQKVQDLKTREWDPRLEALRTILKLLERDGDVG